MRTLIAIVLVAVSIFAQSRSTRADYKVSFGFVGKVGEARGAFNVDAQNRYRIAVAAKATGLAGALSHGRVETLQSEGIVQAGVFVPLTYTNIRNRTSRGDRDVVIYRFDHAAKKIFKEKTRYFKNQVRSHKENSFPYYVPDDILSAFFNHVTALKNAKPGARFRFRAVGSGHKDGYIDIEYPEGERLERLQDLLGDGVPGAYLIAQIHQKIFSSEKGELLLHLSRKGVATRAVLKDVAMFGDFRVKLLKIERE